MVGKDWLYTVVQQLRFLWVNYVPTYAQPGQLSFDPGSRYSFHEIALKRKEHQQAGDAQ